MYCPNCGNQNDDNNKFCWKCGEPLQDDNQNENNDHKSKNLKYAPLLCIIIVLVCVGSLFFTVFKGNTVFDEKDNGNVLSIMTENIKSSVYNLREMDLYASDSDEVLQVLDSYNSAFGLLDIQDNYSIQFTQPINGETWYIYSQVVNDIPVYGTSMVVITNEDSKVTDMFCDYITVDKGITETSNYDEADVIEFAKKITKTEQSEQGINCSRIIAYENEAPVLSYKINIGTNELIISAMSCEVLSWNETVSYLMNEITCYDGNGDYAFPAAFEGQTYYLHDLKRNIKIGTLKNKNSKKGAKIEWLTSSNQFFGDEQQEQQLEYNKGVELYKSLSVLYDFYNNNFGDRGYGVLRASYNDSYDFGANALGGNDLVDGRIVGVVTTGKNIKIEDSFSALAHEYTHVISRRLINWTGETTENKALDEAFSDIMANLIVAKLNNESPKWEVETNCYGAYQAVHAYRNIQKPKLKHYKDYKENMEKHDSCTLISYVTFLMWEGDKKDDIEAINDVDLLMNLWYKTMVILNSDADFEDCMNKCILIAEQMKNNGSLSQKQCDCVRWAFSSVGIGSKTTDNETNEDSVTLTGKVVDEETKNTINGATVQITSPTKITQYITITNKNGEFTINVPTGVLNIIIQKDGYEKYALDTTGKDRKDILNIGVCSLKPAVWKIDVEKGDKSKKDYAKEPETTQTTNNLSLTDIYGCWIADDPENQVSYLLEFSDDGACKYNVIFYPLDEGRYMRSTGTGFFYNGSYKFKNSSKDTINLEVDLEPDMYEVEEASLKEINEVYSLRFTDEGILEATLENGDFFPVSEGPLLKFYRGIYDSDIGAYMIDPNLISEGENQEDQNYVTTSSIPKDAEEFNGHLYYIFNNGGSYEDAEQYCEYLGGHLATITSQAENEFLFNYMQSRELENAYFGLTDRNNEGTWEWINGEPVIYTNWYPEEPNNERGNENYAMFYWKYTAGEWNDGDFGNGTEGDDVNFICEWGEGPENDADPNGNQNTLSKEVVIGEWQIDDDYTMDYNETGMTSIFGTAYEYGNHLLINSDGTISYGIGAGYGGEGTYVIENDCIDAVINKYEDGSQESLYFTAEAAGDQFRLRTYIAGYHIFWIKKV